MTKLVVFLLLGAVINVAVAWGCTTILRPRPLTHDNSSRAECISHMVRYFNIQPEGSFFSGHINRGLSYKRQFASRSASDPWDYKLVVRIETGCPMRSLAGAYLSDRNDQKMGSWYTTAIINPWIADNEQVFNFIPYRPIWLGFALNTLFYAAILWIPFAPFALRHVLRRRRGACLQCGYDLRGTSGSVCPECGQRPMRRSRSSKPSPSGRGFG